MDSSALERALAEALEPKPKDGHGLWQWQRTPDGQYRFWPRQFTTDGNAMLRLIEAMRGQPQQFSIKVRVCRREGDYIVEFVPNEPGYVQANDSSLPLAVATAAAKALGVWVEGSCSPV